MRIRRPSAALIVAVIGLIVAMSGTSYAILKVNSANVVNRSLRGVDVARNTLTGVEINESKLARVPDATRLRGAAASSYIRNTTFRLATGRLVNGESRTFIVNGKVSLSAKCSVNAGGVDSLTIYAATSQDGALMQARDAHVGNGNVLNVATAANDREVLLNSNGGTGQVDANNDTDDGFVLGPDGSYIGVVGDESTLVLNHNGVACSFAIPVLLAHI
jgi:hypothetical protein